MTKDEVKEALSKKGWKLEVHLLGSCMADTLYKDISDIFKSSRVSRNLDQKRDIKVDYKQEMINYAKQKGL